MRTVDSFQGEYRWLSNFWPAQVSYAGVEYPSVECAYQAAKFADPEVRGMFRGLRSGDAKRLGRKYTPTDDWEYRKFGVMLDLVRQKFSNAALRDLLLATGDAELIEGNHWGDTYWGVSNGLGQNNLGKILMQVRTEIVNAARG
jgi:ribA/ribD-fused uncharacterized protein